MEIARIWQHKSFYEILPFLSTLLTDSSFPSVRGVLCGRETDRVLGKVSESRDGMRWVMFSYL